MQRLHPIPADLRRAARLPVNARRLNKLLLGILLAIVISLIVLGLRG